MRSASRIGLLLMGTVLAALVVSRAEAQKQHFLMINNPHDREVYAPWATAVVTGVLLLPEFDADIKSLSLLVSLYSPRKQGGFVIANQGFADVEKIAGEKSYFFKAPLELRVDEEGQYLLKVDCLGPKGKEKAHTLLSTCSIFIEVSKAKGQSDKKPQSKARGETVRINSPEAGTKYGNGASFDAAGTSSSKNVVRMRIRLLQGGATFAENLVREVEGAWQGTVRPPKDGWPEGDVIIEALGLDTSLSPVAGAFDAIRIKTTKVR